MAYTGVFATLVEVQYKAGLNANATASAETYVNSFIGQAESHINVDSEYNWSDAYAGLNADVKGILTEAASNLAAIYIINYDPNAWSLGMATFKINVLWTQYLEAIKLLREKDKGQIFVKEA